MLCTSLISSLKDRPVLDVNTFLPQLEPARTVQVQVLLQR